MRTQNYMQEQKKVLLLHFYMKLNLQKRKMKHKSKMNKMYFFILFEKKNYLFFFHK